MPPRTLSETVDDPPHDRVRVRRPPIDEAAPLNEGEAAALAVLRSHVGRVVTRNALIRAAGVRGLGPRRIDAVLVAVRRHVGPDRLVNVRNRGWMLLDEEGPC